MMRQPKFQLRLLPDPSSAKNRERFLDTIRAIAIIRVILWHAFGAAFLTYVFSAVPAMFFVTGSLLFKSLENRSHRTVLFDRAKRLLVPLWAFAAFAFAAMTVAAVVIGTADTKVPWHRIIFWILPLSDPQGSAWEGGYISAPLWYLRTLFWLLLLSPLFMVAIRKLKGYALIVPTVMVFALDLLARDPKFVQAFSPFVRLPWVVGDIALYSLFFMLGFLHRKYGFDHITKRMWAAAAAVAAVAATAWCLTQPVPGGVVNDSHPAHLFVGFAWLAAAFAAQPLIIAFASLRFIAPVVGWITQRTLTIYLWHSTAIVSAYTLIRPLHLPAIVQVVAILAAVTLATLVFVLAFGWIEDRAGGRRGRIWPLAERTGRKVGTNATRRDRRMAFESRTPMVVRIAVAAGILCLVGSGLGAQYASTNASAIAIRVPSRAPDPIVISSGASGAPDPAIQRLRTKGDGTLVRSARGAALGVPKAVSRDDQKRLDGALESFVNEANLQGATVTILKPGSWSWSGARGTGGGKPMKTDGPVDIESITKTFTAALTYRLADAGKLNLDAPLPPLAAAPSFTYATALTARQLLNHSSGLVTYRDTAQYRANPGSIRTVADALAASQAEPLKFAPGTGSDYSSTNYLVLGLLIEQITGTPFDQHLQRDLLGPLSLQDTRTRPSAPGEPRFSTGGMTSTMHDLAVWTQQLIRDNALMSESAYRALTTPNPTTGIGGGLNGYCPCRNDSNGNLVVESYGLSTGSAMIRYYPASDIIMVINSSTSLLTIPNLQAALGHLLGAATSAGNPVAA